MSGAPVPSAGASVTLRALAAAAALLLLLPVAVDAQTCSYGVLWNAFKRITSGCSLGEKHALYVGTTARTYRLPQFDASLPAFGKA